MILCLERFFKSSVTSDCLKLVGKVLVVKEMLTMVVMIGKIVDEACFNPLTATIRNPAINYL